MRLKTGIVVTVLTIIGLACGYAWFALNTRVGMFVGGGRYFIYRAASAKTPGDARAHLRRVLGSSQYGVNLAENAVRALPKLEDRMRLWRYLIDMAPNDIWRGIYRRDLEKEQTMAARKPYARIDHIILGAADLDRATRAFERMTGVRPVYGGKHPTGTHNALVSLGGHTYLEIIAAQPGAPPPDWLPDLSRFEDPTPVGWAVTADDGPALRRDLVAAGFTLTENKPGERTTPSGATLHWQTFRLAADMDGAPFFILWATETHHPSATSPSGCRLERLAIVSPNSQQLGRLRSALDLPVEVGNGPKVAMTLELSCPNGTIIFRPAR